MSNEDAQINTRTALPGIAWQSLAAGLALFMVVPGSVCIWGHLDHTALFATVPIAAFGWWGFARQLRPFGRAFSFVVVAITMVALAKNVADVLWFGHKPLFCWQWTWMREVPAMALMT